jgi:hypothetical protein
MKNLKVLIVLITILIQACNPEEGNQVEPLDRVPADVMTSIKEKFPAATDLKFSVLENNKVFRSEFKLKGASMAVVVNKEDILNSARLSTENFPDSLKRMLIGLAIEGGDFSNYRLVETADGITHHVADYRLNNISYTLSIQPGGHIYLTTSPQAYETKSLSDLPDGIQNFINDRNKPNPGYITGITQMEGDVKNYFLPRKELAYKKASVFLLPDGTKRYHVYTEFYGIDWSWAPLIFDENARLLWVPGFDQLEIFKFLTMGLGPCILPDQDKSYFRNLFETTPELNGFTFERINPTTGSTTVSNQNASLNAFAGYGGYNFALSKINDSRQFWELKYDTGKKMVDRYYHAHL